MTSADPVSHEGKLDTRTPLRTSEVVSERATILPVTMVNRLSLLVDLSSLLTREVDFDALLATACERVAEALAADRATIWLVDAERNDLVSRVAVLPELPE